MLDIAPARNRTRMLKATLNVGGEYNILDERDSASVCCGRRVSHRRSPRPSSPPGQLPALALVHGVAQPLAPPESLCVFGFALNVHPSWDQLSLGMDYIGLRYGKYSDIATIPIGMKAINLHSPGLVGAHHQASKADGFKAATRARLHRRR